ncbi:hypothetical protein M197_gp40 [Haloarcula hispanica tailed virus 2]|uniref:Uncharacterized protein n=1 Tax=Haloarcula hispanica tailed virus 2 TaxID=1273751 RepID=R4T8J4_9CAUD|nr:hypothetical protein M197_gp40 [Haloarcula hispanica tailed virus 2]AGM11205.1 hypothetical protein HHTV2_40 [Haloarcula hispanica tailed virus 2]
MASTDGDTRNVVHSALSAIWNDGDVRVEVHTVDVSTGTGGAGTANVSHNEEFADGEVYAFATPQSSGVTVAVTSAGATQSTVDVTGGAASGTETVNLLVIGPDASA